MRGSKRPSGGRFEPRSSPGAAAKRGGRRGPRPLAGTAGGGGRRGPRPLALAAGAGAVVVAGAAVAVVLGGGADPESSAAAGATPTTTIERRDLVETQTEDGTLGYADSRTIVNRMAGTVTWLPRAGTVVRTNGRLYAVDGKAVYLLDGSSPAYRDLAPGLSGKDVGALERNLRALGKDPSRAMKVDGTWDAGTTAAVKRWQHDKGLDETGTIELGRVVFAPGDRRVSSLELKVGESAGSGSGGGSDDGSARPAAYDGADPGLGSTQLVAYAAAPAETTTSPTTTTPPATTTPQTTTTPPTSTTPQTTTTAPTSTTPQTTTTPKPSPKPKPKAPAATDRGGGSPAGKGSGGADGSAEGNGSGGGRGGSRPAARAAATGGGGASGGAGGGGGDGSDSGSSAPSTKLMTTTSTRRIVTVALDTTKESVAVQGARVTVELPSGDAVHGRIVRVGTTATSEQNSDGSSTPPTIKVTIKLTERAKAIDQAPVTVQLERSRRRDVLAIPVTALMARSGGSFAVEVVERAGRRIVPVTTGLFTSGYVAIDGEGLKPGMRIANAAV